VEIEVLSTRADGLRHVEEFSIEWRDELPDVDEHDGVSIRRFHALDTQIIGHVASQAIVRRWSREDMAGGAIHPASPVFAGAAVARARARPRRFDLLADVGRGPIVPGLSAHLGRAAPHFDVILAGYSPLALGRQVLMACAHSRRPVLLLPFIHEADRYHHFTSLFSSYERASAVLTLSAHTSAFLEAHCPRARPVTLGAGFAEPPRGALSPGEFRTRYEIGERPMILFVGRKEASKQYHLAIEAVEKLSRDAVLVMVGRNADGKAVASDRVRYLGRLSDADLASAYEACDLFVLPSAYESFGMVFLDAWLRGKPVIGNSSCGASVSLIDHGVDGLLCRDADTIAEAVETLLADVQLRKRLGAAGRAKTLASYTWDRVAERMLETCYELIRATPATGSSEVTPI
jgi:glycosyltransferase involved in cell wall biosynthesis